VADKNGPELPARSWMMRWDYRPEEN